MEMAQIPNTRSEHQISGRYYCHWQHWAFAQNFPTQSSTGNRNSATKLLKRKKKRNRQEDWEILDNTMQFSRPWNHSRKGSGEDTRRHERERGIKRESSRLSNSLVFVSQCSNRQRGIRPAGGGKGPVDVPGEKPGLTEPSCRTYSVALGSLVGQAGCAGSTHLKLPVLGGYQFGTLVYIGFYYSSQGFFLRILWCSWSGHHPENNLAKFGYIIDMKVYIFKIKSFFILGYLLKGIIKLWQLNLKSGEFGPSNEKSFA